MLVAGAGMVLVAVSPFLNWVTGTVQAGSFSRSNSVKPFDEGIKFRLADLIDTTVKVDPIVVLVIAALGIALLALGLAGAMRARTATSLAGTLGGLALALGMMEIQYVSSQPWEGVKASAEVGIYLLVAGGALAIVSQFLPAKRLGG